MKSKFLFGLVALMATFAATADQLDKVLEKGSLRVAVYKDFAPYSYREGSKFVGMDVDIARELASRLNVSLNIMPLTADETMEDDLRNAIWKGHYLGGGVADVMMHVPIDEMFAEDNDRTIMFGAYLREEMGIAYNLSRIPSIASPIVLTEHPIGVEIETLGDYYLSSAFGGKLRENTKHYVSIIETIEALKNGDVAAILAPRAQLEGNLFSGNNGKFKIASFNIPGVSRTEWDVGLGIKVGNPDLYRAMKKAMEEIREDGTLNKILMQYGISYIEPATQAAFNCQEENGNAC